MSDNQSIGRKYDQGKPLSATVLAGFWRVAGRDELAEALLHSEESAFDVSTVETLLDVFDEFFDVDLSIDDRVHHACMRVGLYLEPELYLRGAIEVGSYGARKYERDNWLHVDDGINRYYEAVGRHVEDLICGHWYDDDKEDADGNKVEGSHLPNLSHIFWGILAAGELLSRKRDAELDIETVEENSCAVCGDQPPCGQCGTSSNVVIGLAVAGQDISVGQLVCLDADGKVYVECDYASLEHQAVAEIILASETKPEPLPGLVLPLEVGKKYRVTYRADSAYQMYAPGTTFVGEAQLRWGGAVVSVHGWYYDQITGVPVSADLAPTLEGPVSE